MSLKYLDMTNQEQAIWNAAFGAACSSEFRFTYERTEIDTALRSAVRNCEIAWEVDDAAVLAHRKWKQELTDLKD